MGFISRLLGREAKSKSAHDSLDLFREIYGGRESRSGVPVNWKTALDVSTVLACVRVIANGVSQVPFHLVQEVNGRRNVVYDDLGMLLYRRPNPWQTSYEFRETIMFHILLTGNAFVFVNRVGSERKVIELIPIEPGRVSVKQKPDYSLEYRVSADANQSSQTFGSDAIWHLRGPSWNTWLGLDAVKLAREAIGLTVSLEQGQAEFQKNGAQTSGVMSMTQKLSPDRFEFLSKWLDKHLPGGDRFGKPLIIDDAAKYTSMIMSAVDQQLIETRKFQIEEICREFGVMPIMVGYSDKAATYASAEQMFIAHAVHTLDPWYQRVQQSADVNLLSERQRAEGYYTKLRENALMRGAAKDRAEYYSKGLGAGGGKGWLTPNDVRGFEDMDLSNDPEADELPQPIVKQSASDNPENPAPAEE